MAHIHLFEFEDQPWFPDVIREGMMDFLRHGITWTSFYEPVAPLIKGTMEETDCHQLVELCAGGGGGVLKMSGYLAALGIRPKIILTDLYPKEKIYEALKEDSDGSIDYVARPVNALQVPETLQGMRILFSSFHHFKPAEARQILQDAVNSRAPIGIFDAGNKSILTIIFGVLLLQPVAFFLLTPFFKPFSWSRLFFTYLLPLIPLCTLWDGSVSVLRFYTVQDLEQLASETASGQYLWKAGQVKNRWGLKVNYLTGQPAGTNQ